MSDIFELTAEKRLDVGKGASRRLRRDKNLIPAVIYGAGEPAVNIMLPHHVILHALENEAFYSHILTIKLDKEKTQVLLKALQRHPYKKQIMHMDFLRIKKGETLQRHVPLHFINEDAAPGVKMDGGVIQHHMTDVEISCIPADLPEFIEIDLANLGLNESIYLGDISLPQGVSLAADLTDEQNNLPIVAIHPPRVIQEVEETAPEEAPETEITSAKQPEAADDSNQKA